MILYTAILDTKIFVVFWIFFKNKHIYLQFMSTIPSPQPNLNIIHNLKICMQKNQKDKENINNKRRNRKDHT